MSLLKLIMPKKKSKEEVTLKENAYLQCQKCRHNSGETETFVDCVSEGLVRISKLKTIVHCAAQDYNL